MTRLLLLTASLLLPLAAADLSPHARAALDARYPGWQPAPVALPIQQWFSEYRFPWEPNRIRADFDGDGSSDLALLIIHNLREKAVVLINSEQNGRLLELASDPPDPYSYLLLYPKGSRDFDFERGRPIRYARDSFGLMYFERTPVTFQYQGGGFDRMLALSDEEAAAAAAPAAEESPAPRTVILVRHAERAGGMASDVGISEEGRCRAQGLAAMLADAHLTAIYTSEVARTQQTAEPVARKTGVKPQVIPAKDIAALAAKLRNSAAGSAMLVVGHSNTVPAIAKELGAGTVPPIPDTEFDRMLIVTLLDGGTASVVTLRYPGCQSK